MAARDCTDGAITLTSDIRLTKPWELMESFRGTISGNNHTIKNIRLLVPDTTVDNGDIELAFIEDLSDSTVSDLTLTATSPLTSPQT